MDKEFILWLCSDKLRLVGKDWDNFLSGIIDQKYAEYKGWV